VIRKHLLCWFVLAIVAISNGVLRQYTYGKVLSNLSAHQLSTVTGILATGVAVWMMHKRWPLQSPAQAWTIGILWLLFTIVFEFGFGHFVAGHSWAHLLAEYDLFQGRVWSLFLIWIAIMPRLFHRLSGPPG
jgi:hypothetical protein